MAAAVLNPEFGLDRGFDRYEHPPDLELPADVQVDRAEAMLREMDRPFFLWVHFFDAHLDYIPPQEQRRYFEDQRGSERYDRDPNRFTAEVTQPAEKGVLPQVNDLPLAEALHDGEIAYLDAELGRLFEHVKTRALWNNTLVVVTADHGESFRREYPFDHADRLYDEIVRVPLIVKPPGKTAPRRIAGPVELTGVTPTILDVLDIAPPAPMDGRSLQPLWQDSRNAVRPAYSEAPRTAGPLTEGGLLSVRDAAAKYVYNTDLKTTELFNVTNGRAVEAKNLCEGDPGRCAIMRRFAEEFLGRFAAENVPAPAAPTGELKRKLQALGYLDENE